MYWSLPSGRSRLSRSSAYFCLRASMSIVVTEAVNTKLDRAVKTLTLRVRPMAREVVTVGWRRDVVLRSDGVAADEHEIPKNASASGCGWPVALTLDVDPAWRSGYYEVVMEIDVGEKVRRDYAFFVVRPSSG